jgi:hypothetical protein
MSVTLNQSSDYPFAVCKNCLRGFDFSGEWSFQNQDPTGRVRVTMLANDLWAELRLECPYCFYSDIYRAGEFRWAHSDETKIREILEAEVEALRKNKARLEKQLSDAKKAKSRLLRDNKKLADSLMTLLPEDETTGEKSTDTDEKTDGPLYG